MCGAALPAAARDLLSSPLQSSPAAVTYYLRDPYLFAETFVNVFNYNARAQGVTNGAMLRKPPTPGGWVKILPLLGHTASKSYPKLTRRHTRAHPQTLGTLINGP